MKTFLILGMLLVFLVGGKVILSTLQPQDDKKLIQEALTESIKASREGRPGGVMDKLSVNIKYNDQDVSGNSRDIARYIRESKPDIVVENPEPDISGEEAKINSPVTLSVSFLGHSVDKRIKNVTLIFRKESDRDYLIFPATKWKLAEVRVPDDSVAGLVQ